MLSLFSAFTSAEDRAGGGDPGKPDYRGRLTEDRDARVAFFVERHKGVRQSVVFDARRVDHSCSDGTEREFSLTGNEFYFYRPRVFRGRIRAYPDGPVGYSGRYRVRGRLNRGGKARGYLLDVDNRPEEDPSPSCKTDGRLRWEAKEVR